MEKNNLILYNECIKKNDLKVYLISFFILLKKKRIWLHAYIGLHFNDGKDKSLTFCIPIERVHQRVLQISRARLTSYSKSKRLKGPISEKTSI